MVLVLITIIVCQTNNLMKLKRTKKKSMSLDMGTEYNIGLTEQIMKDNGTTTKQKDKVLSYMPKGIYTEENSKMIWQTDMVNTSISMEASIKENLKTMFKKDTEKKNGLTAQNMSDLI